VKGASQGSGGLLTPLFQLVRDPYGTIVGTTNTQDAPDVEEEGDLEDRKQVLYLRMKDVGAATSEVIFTC
jgi:TAG lipase/steryl ester hydrolase/phospholipase A2/LPA acyltransferase